MARIKVRKSIMVSSETHEKLKIEAKRVGFSIDELIKFYIDNTEITHIPSELTIKLRKGIYG